MRLKCIVLDGFKSYAHRQEIGDLDPHFNAITGLNGSGKSNIFDALCFVMGISNLKRVRAEDTRDLIFKSGNAGIQKASVTIEFINDDPFNHPPGYTPADCPLIRISRQVLVGGKQKFFLNDRVSDQAKVKTFFHNALLNVDNAHFMVLQGTVHKMIGMKSSEILGLLEEASGTRVFDTRRRTAENLLRSKEKRVESINATIEEITPRVQSMKQQQEEYSKFVQAREGLAERTKFQIAYNFWYNLRSAEEKRNKSSTVLSNIEQRKKQLIEIPGQRDEANARLAQLSDAAQQPTEAIERLHNIENELRKEAAKSKTLLDAADKAIKGLERDVKRIQGEKDNIDKQLEKFKVDSSKFIGDHVEQDRQRKEAKQNIDNIKESIRLNRAGVQAGLNGMSAQEELDTSKRRMIVLAGEMGRSQDHLERLRTEQKKLKQEAEKDQQSLKSIQLAVAKATDLLKKAEDAYEPYKKEAQRYHELRNTYSNKREELRIKMREVLDQSSIAPPLQYDPIPGVNVEAAIHGRVGELVVPNEDKYTLALTVGAGVMSITKIVIEHDSIAQQLVEKGRLRTRVNFLPLNRIEARPISDKQIKVARDIASSMGESVELATSYVRFDNIYRDVAALTYGSFVICSSLKLATELANNPQTRMKAVTFDGDMADPMGLVAGGSNKGLRDWVREFAHIAKKKAPLRDLEATISQIANDLQQAERSAAKAKPLQEELARADQHHSEIQNQYTAMASNSATYRLDKLTKSIADVEPQIEMQTKEKQATETRIAELLEMMKADPKKNEEALKAKLAAEEKKLSALIESVNKDTVAFERMEQQKVELEQKSVDTNSDLDGKNQDLVDKRKERLGYESEAKRVSESQTNTTHLLKAETDKSAALNKEAEECKEELKLLNTHEDLFQKEIKDGEATSKILRREAEAEQHKADHISRDHSWVLREQATFGPVNGTYYFDDEARTKKALVEVEQLKAMLAQSERSVNEKASMLYEEYQKDLNTLIQQRESLATDREIIFDSITAVEKRKWGALDKMFHTVSGYFGKLFSMCLPGASSRLVEERCPDTNRLTGLQVKVTFNGREKESLTELSGGQRSLLALCLILAILRVRPAPVYILDEVDAALDPSHTQNIGQMLQTHFPNSQFLLVSLKDGMFNNANVLYEIRNTQGYSEVTRRSATRKK